MDVLSTQFLKSIDALERSFDEVPDAAAVPLRQLLLDGSPLAQRVAASRKQKLTFSVTASPSPIFPARTALAQSEASGHGTVSLSLPQFLSVGLATIGRASVTVKDVIKYFAHVSGAIHAGAPENPAEQALDALRLSGEGREVAWPEHALHSIGLVVLGSLADLRSGVLGSYRFENAVGLSLVLSIVMESMGGDRENLIVDLGTERSRSRLMVLVDADDRLVVRCFDGKGSRALTRAPGRAVALEYGQRATIEICVGWLRAKLLMRVDTGTWCTERIVDGDSSAAILAVPSVVVGSDIDGTAASRFRLLEYIAYGRVLTSPERLGLRKYCETNQPEQELVFSPGHYLYSRAHPVRALPFDLQRGPPTDLVQRDPAKQPTQRRRVLG